MILRHVKNAYALLRKYGLPTFLKLVLVKLCNILGSAHVQIDLIKHYDFIKIKKIGPIIDAKSVEKNTLNWVVPPFVFGSGGHLTIFRFIQHLEKQGFNCRIIIVGELLDSSVDSLSKKINNWFVPVSASVYVGINNAPPSYITIATSWDTAYHVRNFQSTIHKCYFVQDFEPYFHAAGSEYAWAEETYRFGFWGITAGDWLESKLAIEFGMQTTSFSFSYDEDRYKVQPRQSHDIRQIFFYARPPTQRRAFELGLLVLDRVVSEVSGLRVVFAGWDVSTYKIPFDHLNAGVVASEELAKLYHQCDLGLVLSFSNLSLLPLELMACGVPVISNRAPCTEWLLNDDIACLSEPTVEKLAAAIINLLNDDVESQRLKTAGLDFVRQTSWQKEAKKVGSFLNSLGCTLPVNKSL